MGCDIHMYREQLVDNKWTSMDEWTTRERRERDDPERLVENWKASIRYETQLDYNMRRNYSFFGYIHEGVRAEHPLGFAIPGKGVPGDVSRLVQEEIDGWKQDMHSISWLTVEEIKTALTNLLVSGEPIKEYIIPDLSYLLNEIQDRYDGPDDEYRVIFGFDN